MYTVFRPELDDLAREILARYRAYQEGRTTPAELDAYRLDAFRGDAANTRKSTHRCTASAWRTSIRRKSKH